MQGPPGGPLILPELHRGRTRINVHHTLTAMTNMLSSKELSWEMAAETHSPSLSLYTHTLTCTGWNCIMNPHFVNRVQSNSCLDILLPFRAPVLIRASLPWCPVEVNSFPPHEKNRAGHWWLNCSLLRNNDNENAFQPSHFTHEYCKEVISARRWHFN